MPRSLFATLVLCFTLVSSLMMGPDSARGQNAPAGALILAHGGSEEWNAQVLDLASRVRDDIPAEVAILDGPGAKEHRFQDALGRLVAAGVGEIVVVPLMVSSHSFFFESIRYLTAETDSIHPMMAAHYQQMGIERPDVGVPLRLAAALDDAPELARILADRALSLAHTPKRQAVLLVAHGPDETEPVARARWMENLRRVAERVQDMGGFRDVRVGMIPAARGTPAVRSEAIQRARDLVELQHAATGEDVVVVPVLMARGAHGDETIPTDLAGLPIAYSGEVLIPHPALSRWFESRVQQSSKTGADAVPGI